MKREKRKINHESTKIGKHERKHERRGAYIENHSLFRAFQFSCFRDGFLFFILYSVSCLLYSLFEHGERTTVNG